MQKNNEKKKIKLINQGRRMKKINYPKKLSGWQTSDGRKFQTQEEAEKHEEGIQIKKEKEEEIKQLKQQILDNITNKKFIAENFYNMTEYLKYSELNVLSIIKNHKTLIEILNNIEPLEYMSKELKDEF
jgi:hypothetical protein